MNTQENETQKYRNETSKKKTDENKKWKSRI